MPVVRGDLIDPRLWPTDVYENLEEKLPGFKYGILLRVTGAMHFVIEVEGQVLAHRTGIFTEALMDVAQSRP